MSMTTNSIHDLQPQLSANRRFWTGWSGSEPDTELPIYRTDIDQPLLNGVLRTRHQPLDHAIDKAKRQLTGSTWSWWVGDDSEPGTAKGLVARGAEQIIEMPIMAIDVAGLATVDDDAADLDIRQVSGRTEMIDYVRAYAEPLGFPANGIDAAAERELAFAYPEVTRLAGVVDGKMVGTCTLSLGTEVGALYCIATDANYRGRGIATALTRESLRLARESGRRIVTLQASSLGEPVYKRIGFETVGHYRLFQFAA